ncbi:MAG: hypothetical protein WD875_13760 [Pirellulales bacterium]
MALVASGGLLFGPLAARSTAQFSFEQEPFNYNRATPTDVVAKLNARLEAGEASLERDDQHGYLAAVLKLLGVPQSSQMLVYSKTSFQQKRIHPRAPRALYFNDDVYIGWVQGGDVVEVSAVDPQLGAVFYTLDQRRTERPRFARQTYDCTQCHASALTGGVPGHVVRSVYPSPDGTPILRHGSFLVDHTTPIKQRWGGWYVSGKHGSQKHLGNLLVREQDDAERLASGEYEMGDRANVMDLRGRIDVSPYLSPYSDVVALLVLEHQTMAQNAIARAYYQGKLALRDEHVMNEALERPAGHRSESSQRRLESIAASLVEVLLFVDEAPLTEPISGASSFAEDFPKAGPRDADGRSLREFDLKTRLFRYPCSYLIYGEAFAALSDDIKQLVYRKMWDVLQDARDDAKYKHLSAADRRAIREILIATKDDLPDYWKTLESK